MLQNLIRRSPYLNALRTFSTVSATYEVEATTFEDPRAGKDKVKQLVSRYVGLRAKDVP